MSKQQGNYTFMRVGLIGLTCLVFPLLVYAAAKQRNDEKSTQKDLTNSMVFLVALASFLILFRAEFESVLAVNKHGVDRLMGKGESIMYDKYAKLKKDIEQQQTEHQQFIENKNAEIQALNSTGGPAAVKKIKKLEKDKEIAEVAFKAQSALINKKLTAIRDLTDEDRDTLDKLSKLWDEYKKDRFEREKIINAKRMEELSKKSSLTPDEQKDMDTIQGWLDYWDYYYSSGSAWDVFTLKGSQPGIHKKQNWLARSDQTIFEEGIKNGHGGHFFRPEPERIFTITSDPRLDEVIMRKIINLNGRGIWNQDVIANAFVGDPNVPTEYKSKLTTFVSLFTSQPHYVNLLKMNRIPIPFEAKLNDPKFQKLIKKIAQQISSRELEDRDDKILGLLLRETQLPDGISHYDFVTKVRAHPAFKEKYVAPYNQGRQAGLIQGYKQGEQKGLTEGYKQGEQAGLIQGYEQGEQKGLTKGYKKGREENIIENKYTADENSIANSSKPPTIGGTNYDQRITEPKGDNDPVFDGIVEGGVDKFMYERDQHFQKITNALTKIANADSKFLTEAYVNEATGILNPFTWKDLHGIPEFHSALATIRKFNVKVPQPM